MNKTTTALLACLVAASCSGSLGESASPSGSLPSEAELTPVTFTLGETGTKTTGTVAESTVSDWVILLVNSVGELEESALVSGSGSTTIRARKGSYTAHVFANTGKPLSFWNSGNADGNFRINLADEASGKLRMRAERSITVTGTASKESFALDRRVASVRLSKVSVNFGFSVGSFILKRMYLTNAAGNCFLGSGEFFPSQWHNRTRYQSSSADGLLKDEVNASITKTSPHTTVHTFYTYANPVTEDVHGGDPGESYLPRFTRLVLECTLDGLTYYYAVDLPGIEANHRYAIAEVEIQNRGSLDPDDPAKLDAKISVSEDWSGQRDLDEDKGRRTQS